MYLVFYEEKKEQVFGHWRNLDLKKRNSLQISKTIQLIPKKQNQKAYSTLKMES